MRRRGPRALAFIPWKVRAARVVAAVDAALTAADRVEQCAAAMAAAQTSKETP
jgi:hypothetical protein